MAELSKRATEICEVLKNEFGDYDYSEISSKIEQREKDEHTTYKRRDIIELARFEDYYFKS